MAQYQTQYQSLPSMDEDTDNDDVPTQDADFMMHVVPESTRWNHIENLDDFFTRVYHYHQRGGYICMVLSDILQLVQFLFVVVFSTFLIECVDYDILFANIKRNDSHKVTIPESLIPDCTAHIDFSIVVCILVAMVFWVFRLIKVAYNIFKYTEIRSFYVYALKISASELPNMTWHEVQRRLLEVQKEQQMCIHKQELTELDIYHRILRFKNYQIAMEKKSILPLKYTVPFVGPCLSQRILWIGIANFVLSPLIFLWQILYSFFRYADVMSKDTCTLILYYFRSNYARLYLRHYNELDHEFDARLNRGYRAANKYMEIFTSKLLTIVAKNIAFFAGSILAVLVVLTVIDEDVLAVEHVLTTMTVAGLIVTACKVLIPDEHMVYCPEILMRNILAHVHYMPTDWAGNAHTTRVRDEFSNLFQYKLTEDKVMPMSVRLSPAEEGKVEMSLMHFHLTNPEWKPPKECSLFINDVKEQAQKDITSLSVLQPEVAGLFTSSQGSLPSLALASNVYGQQGGYNSLASSVAIQSTLYPHSTNASLSPSVGGVHHRLRGGIAHAEGPIGGASTGILGSMQSSGSLHGSAFRNQTPFSARQVDEGTLELMSHDMSFSALYLHDLQQKRVKGQGQPYENLEDIRARAMWNRHDSNQATTAVTPGGGMPNIQEREETEKENQQDVRTSV
ncbi:hypothetical protein FSP39_015123 [Pinctada imbricata]|uniref:Autophagy-related protein 9 n=1 Tax=Pinctada imbricata TaxID=66713 RepID=A0AA88YGH3_PINIB|nr:hypothetical protein FSP39_015123 [Pinctada imbricata]